MSVSEKFIKVELNVYPTSVVATYDSSGEVDYSDVFKQSANDFRNITVLAGAPLVYSIYAMLSRVNLGSRVDSRLVDISAKAGYALVGAGQTDPYAQASEYYQVNFLYLHTLEQLLFTLSSLIGNMDKHQRNLP